MMSYDQLDSSYNELICEHLSLQQKYDDLKADFERLTNQYNDVIKQNSDLQKALRSSGESN